jgi:hypothetical protein
MQASASAAPQAATIHDEESPTMSEVSDAVNDDTTVINDDTTVVDNDTSNDDNNNDTSDNNRGDDTVFFCAARDIMNRVGR